MNTLATTSQASVVVQQLAARIQAIERRPVELSSGRCDGWGFVATGWSAVDEALAAAAREIPEGPFRVKSAAAAGGLARGAVHEWFGTDDPAGGREGRWSAPLCILAHLVRQALRGSPEHPGGPGQWVLWIGRACRPHPPMLARAGGRDGRLLERSIFADPPDAASRLWLIDLALRCPAFGAVVADGAGLDMAATRRLQLAAAGGGALALLARPTAELGHLSAAKTRWRVQPALCEPSAATASSRPLRPRWRLELLRCKGTPPVDATCRWVVEWDDATGTVGLPAELADRPGQAAPATRTGRQRRA